MRQQLLLIQDVDDLGRSGDLVNVKAGFARNYLLPQKMAVRADKNTLRMQERLQAERKKQAEIDRKESEKFAAQLDSITLKIDVKVDPEGHMYGSVNANDIVELLKEEGISLDKKQVQVKKPIKETGTHSIAIELKEEVDAKVTLKIIPEGVIEAEVDEVIVKPVDAAEESVTEENLEPPKSEDKWTEQEKKEVNEASKEV